MEPVGAGRTSNRWRTGAGLLAWCALLLVGGLTIAPWAKAQIVVSEGGTPIYSQAIAVPPGVAGMSPRIGLLYSGGGVNGPVGLGWTVQGISAITRCAAIVAIDGPVAARAVTYTPADKLCLDGQRLIQTDASGSTVGIAQVDDSQGLDPNLVREYRTEKDSYARIRAYGKANGDALNGPAYFKVWTKAGQVFEYGASLSADANTKAQATVQGRPIVMAWAVARIADTLGNFVDFKYEQRDSVAWGSGPVSGAPTPGHEWNVKEIQYSGNKVVFTYDSSGSRTDKAEAYQQGSKNVSARRLESITTYINSTNTGTLGPGANAVPVKTIKIGYDYGARTGRSRVATITECAGNAASTRCLPATLFGYSAGGDANYVANAIFAGDPLATLPMQSTAGNLGVLVADFDGDGKSDLLRWSDTPALNKLYFSNGDGSFRNVAAFDILSENLFKSDGCYVSTVADFNGDGLPDILRYSNVLRIGGIGSCAAPAGTSYLYLGQGDGSFVRKDINGPTLQRLISLTILGCADGSTPPSGQNCPGGEPPDPVGWTRGETFYLLDVDGDGKLDVVTASLPLRNLAHNAPDPCAAPVVCARVYKGDGNGTFAEITGTNIANKVLYTPPDPGYSIGQPRHVADLDGDGLADIVGISNLYSTGPASWRSRGDGNFDLVTVSAACDVPIDFNGDGRTDCLSPTQNVLRVSDGSYATQNVAGFNLTNVVLSAGTAPNFTAGVVVLDIDGDRRQDILRWMDDATQTALYVSNGGGTFTASAAFAASFNTVANQLRTSNGTTDFVAGDFTGRGSVELLRLKDSPSAGAATSNRLFTKTDTTPADQLIKVTSGTGATTELTYRPLANAGTGADARYTSDRGGANQALFPTVDLTFPLYVVATASADSGVGTTKVATEYSYLGLKADLTGRGMLGFREVRRQMKAPDGSDLTSFTSYLQQHPYIGVASGSITRLGTLNDTSALLLSNVASTYCELTADAATLAAATPTSPCPVPPATKVQRPYLRKSVETAKDLNGLTLPTVTTTNTFNASGNPTQINVVTTGGFIKSTSHLYQADDTADDNWILGRLTRTTVTNTVPDQLTGMTTSAGTGSYASATTGTGPIRTGQLSAIAFGMVNVGASTTLTSTLANNGIASFSVTIPTASSVTGTDFSFVSTTCAATLAVGASCTVSVKFQPTAVAARTGTLSIVTGAGTLTASLSGSGGGSIVTMTANNASALSAIKGGVSASGTVTFTNSGTLSATLTMSGLSSPYSVSPTSCSAAAGGTCVVTVTMSTGGSVGSQGTQTLTATGGTTGPATATVSGSLLPSTTTVTVSPTSYNFGTIAKCLSSTPKVFTVANTGSNAATVAYAIVHTSSTTPGAFTASGTCGTLAPSASCTVSVVYDANSVGGNVSGRLDITGSNFTTASATLSAATSSSGLCN